MATSRLHIVGSRHTQTPAAIAELKSRYGHVSLDSADVIVALGGDGFMLRVLHEFVDTGLPVYGMRLGRVGFLMNRYQDNDLLQRLEQADCVALKPLQMQTISASGEERTEMAINEVALLRQKNQAAHLQIMVNDAVKIEELVADGVLVSTAAGSSAYNFSAYGPILPLDSNALALTPISPFRPRRWRGAVLPAAVKIVIDSLDHQQRPVSATADFIEVRDVVSVAISEDQKTSLKLMFDPDHSLEERILNEQFR